MPTQRKTKTKVMRSDSTMETRPSIFGKAKEQLRNSPPPTQTPSGRLLLRSSKKKKVSAASFHFESIKRNSEMVGRNVRNRSLMKSSSMGHRKRGLSQAEYNTVRRTSNMIASTLGLPPPPSIAPPPILPKELDTDSAPTPPPPQSSALRMDTIEEHTNSPRMEKRRSHPQSHRQSHCQSHRQSRPQSRANPCRPARRRRFHLYHIRHLQKQRPMT